MTNQDTLITQVFKAKYFPIGNFLDTNLGHTPSFVHSIHASRVVVRQDLQWRIGDESSINVWSQPCLIDEGTPYVSSIPNSLNYDLNVGDFIDHE